MAFGTIEKGLALLFGAIIVGIVFTNGKGVSALITSLGTFTNQTVGAFSGNKGFIGG